jgi:hypothetical protein
LPPLVPSITTTIFWIGEHPSTNNPLPNDASSRDPNWFANYGGYDDPDLNLRKKFAENGSSTV